MGGDTVLVAGELLWDFFPAGRKNGEDTTYERRAGGAPANVAVALARLGLEPFLWTRVGDDQFGRDLERTIVEHGVHSTVIERDPEQPTTLAFVDPAAEDFLFYRGADATLSPATLPIEQLADVQWVVTGGVGLTAEPARSAITGLLEAAAGRSCSVLFDPNYRPELWAADDFAEIVGDRLELIDVLTATREEVALLADGADTLDEAAETIHTRGPHTVCVTEGAKGARLVSSGAAPWGSVSVTRPGYRVDTVDPVGAGDAFTAGLLWALLEGTSGPGELVERANAVAALATTGVGAMTALPSRDAVETFLDGRR